MWDKEVFLKKVVAELELQWQVGRFWISRDEKEYFYYIPHFAVLSIVFVLYCSYNNLYKFSGLKQHKFIII